MTLRRILLALTALLLTVGGTLVGSGPAAAAPGAAAGPTAAMAAWDSDTGTRLAQWECSTSNICFWTGPDGTGSRCMWDVADPDWATGNVRCSWALTQNVKSVWNRGTSGATGVAYYRSTDYVNRAGCTRQGQSGNLAGTYKLRSHKWISSSCG